MTDSLMIGFSRSVTLTGIRSPKLHRYHIWTPGLRTYRGSFGSRLIGHLATVQDSHWPTADNLPSVYHHIRIHRFQLYYEDMIRIWDNNGPCYWWSHHWPVIGQHRSRDLNTVSWLAVSDQSPQASQDPGMHVSGWHVIIAEARTDDHNIAL